MRQGIAKNQTPLSLALNERARDPRASIYWPPLITVKDVDGFVDHFAAQVEKETEHDRATLFVKTASGRLLKITVEEIGTVSGK